MKYLSYGLVGSLCLFLSLSPVLAGDTFTFAAAIPIVSSINPSSGPVGTQVQILGSNFTGVTGVKFGSTSATSFAFVNDNSITAVAPTGTGTVTVFVTTPAGTNISPN